MAAERLLLWRLVPLVSPVAELHPAAAGSVTDCRRSCLELLQDWDAQQKAQREHILAGWKPDDDEEEDKDSGEHGDWTFAGGVWCVAGQLLLPGHAHMFLAAKLVAPPLLPA